MALEHAWRNTGGDDDIAVVKVDMRNVVNLVSRQALNHFPELLPWASCMVLRLSSSLVAPFGSSVITIKSSAG